MNEEILKERERIKRIIEKEIKAKIKEHRIKHISVLDRLQEDLFFKIDHPDHARKESKI